MRREVFGRGNAEDAVLADTRSLNWDTGLWAGCGGALRARRVPGKRTFLFSGVKTVFWAKKCGQTCHFIEKYVQKCIIKFQIRVSNNIAPFGGNLT